MFRFPLCLYILLLHLCLFVFTLRYSGLLGPADLVFRHMEHCEPEQHIVDFWINQRKFNRTTNVMDITWSSPYPIDEMVTLEFNGSMKKEGGYKPGAFYFKDSSCVALKKILGDIFLMIIKKAGLEKCPLEAGEHAALDFYFDNEQFTVPLLYGEYKLDILIHREGRLESCLIAYFDLVPKNSD